MRSVALDEAPRRIVEIDAFAATLPIADVVEQRRARVVAGRYPQDEATIGTPNCVTQSERVRAHGFRIVGEVATALSGGG